jgi:hypothetical protein
VTLAGPLTSTSPSWRRARNPSQAAHPSRRPGDLSYDLDFAGQPGLLDGGDCRASSAATAVAAWPSARLPRRPPLVQACRTSPATGVRQHAAHRAVLPVRLRGLSARLGHRHAAGQWSVLDIPTARGGCVRPRFSTACSSREYLETARYVRLKNRLQNRAAGQGVAWAYIRRHGNKVASRPYAVDRCATPP